MRLDYRLEAIVVAKKRLKKLMLEKICVRASCVRLQQLFNDEVTIVRFLGTFDS